MGIEDQLIDSFKQEEQLMIKEGGKKINLWQSAKDSYYKSLFSGGIMAMPAIEKVLGTESANEIELLMRYMSGSGEDTPLSEDQGVIDDYLQAVHKSSDEWQPTTNPELNPTSGVPYADEGWEFTQVDVKQVLQGMEDEYNRPEYGTKSFAPSKWADIYNKLGLTSSVRRRKLEDGSYEYMIVEPWDLIVGSGEEEGGPFETTTYATGSVKMSREVPKALGFLAKFAPDFLDKGKTRSRGDQKKTTRIKLQLSDYGEDWLEDKAQPFNITGSSIISK